MLLLEKVTIERFRGILRGTVSGLTEVNVLVGRNNCGKSTIAEAITLAAASTSRDFAGRGHEDPFGRPRHQLWRQARGESVGMEPAEPLWFRGDQNHEIRIGLEGGADRVVFAQSRERAVTIERTDTRYEAPFGLFLGRLTAYLPSLPPVAPVETAMWNGLLMGRKDKALVKTLAESFGLQGLEQVQQRPDGKLWLLFSDFAVPLDSQGDGVRAALRCLMPLALLEQTLYVVEEPEVHQHPGALARFARALCRLARERAVQLLVTTHSLECATALLDGADAVGSEAAVFHLGLADGELQVRRIDEATARALGEVDTDLRELGQYV